MSMIHATRSSAPGRECLISARPARRSFPDRRKLLPSAPLRRRPWHGLGHSLERCPRHIRRSFPPTSTHRDGRCLRVALLAGEPRRDHVLAGRALLLPGDTSDHAVVGLGSSARTKARLDPRIAAHLYSPTAGRGTRFTCASADQPRPASGCPSGRIRAARALPAVRWPLRLAKRQPVIENRAQASAESVPTHDGIVLAWNRRSSKLGALLRSPRTSSRVSTGGVAARWPKQSLARRRQHGS